MTNENNGGLKEKYIVLKPCETGEAEVMISDVVSVSATTTILKGSQQYARRKRSWSFVLSPEKNDAYGAASREAMRVYARKIMKTNRELGRDLLATVNGIEKDIG